jgi:hypothetical protein
VNKTHCGLKQNQTTRRWVVNSGSLDEQGIESNRATPPGGSEPATLAQAPTADYFCQVRFLWRCARSFLRRLCLLIFAFRRFFNEPIIEIGSYARIPSAAFSGRRDSMQRAQPAGWAGNGQARVWPGARGVSKIRGQDGQLKLPGIFLFLVFDLTPYYDDCYNHSIFNSSR